MHRRQQRRCHWAEAIRGLLKRHRDELLTIREVAGAAKELGVRWPTLLQKIYSAATSVRTITKPSSKGELSLRPLLLKLALSNTMHGKTV